MFSFDLSIPVEFHFRSGSRSLIVVEFYLDSGGVLI